MQEDKQQQQSGGSVSNVNSVGEARALLQTCQRESSEATFRGVKSAKNKQRTSFLLFQGSHTEAAFSK